MWWLSIPEHACICICVWTCIRYVYLLYDGWWMVRWVHFTYLMACSVKRSGLIAFSQCTTELSGCSAADSFAELIINVLEELTLRVARFEWYNFNMENVLWIAVFLLQLVMSYMSYTGLLCKLFINFIISNAFILFIIINLEYMVFWDTISFRVGSYSY